MCQYFHVQAKSEQSSEPEGSTAYCWDPSSSLPWTSPVGPLQMGLLVVSVTVVQGWVLWRQRRSGLLAEHRCVEDFKSQYPDRSGFI